MDSVPVQQGAHDAVRGVDGGQGDSRHCRRQGEWKIDDGIDEVAADEAVTDKDPGQQEQYAIDLVKAAGFELVGAAEINANPKDTRDYEQGVWTLPPTWRLGDKDRDRYAAVGESDRFTLKFRKPLAR